MSDLFLGAPTSEHDEVPPSRRSRQGSKQQRHREQRRRRRRTVIVLLIAIALVAGAGYVVWNVVGGAFDGGGDETVQDYEGPGQGEAQVTVSPGDSGGEIGQKLVDAGVVATVKAFSSAYAANSNAQSIQPGTYSLRLEMRASDAVNALLETANRVSYRVTIPEGFTKQQVYERIYEITAIPVEDLEAAAQDPAAIGLPAEAGGNVEGWLFPLTYEVEPGATAQSVLAQMVAHTVQVLTAKGVAQDQWETVLNKASLVEREARRDEDRPKMARAIQNRLDQGMLLQIDATTLYGLGVTGRSPTTAENQDASNLYSTYKYVGLPPGPIASPGETSIDAVLAPADGPWLFWVAVNLDTGETLFTDNFDEHRENIQKLNDWLAANPS